MDRNAPIQELNGVGPKTEKILQKLGVYTVGDILLAFPRDYKQMPEPEHISVAEPEKVYAFHVRLCSSPVTRSTRAMQISTAQFSDGTGKVEAGGGLVGPYFFYANTGPGVSDALYL